MIGVHDDNIIITVYSAYRGRIVDAIDQMLIFFDDTDL